MIVGLADIAGADRFQVPDVAELALVRQVFVAEGLGCLSDMAGDHAALLAESLDRAADVPDQRELVFIEFVVVAPLVIRVVEFLPAAVRLLLEGAAPSDLVGSSYWTSI